MVVELATYLLAYDDSESAKKALRRTIELVSPRDLIVLAWVVPDEEKFSTFGGDGDGGAAARLERVDLRIAPRPDRSRGVESDDAPERRAPRAVTFGGQTFG